MANEQLGFYIDLRSCSGCKACQIACRDKNNTNLGVLWRRVYEIGGGSWQEQGDALIDNTFSYFVSSACSHCNEPACVPVCPTGAITKRAEDGVVIIDRSKCIGCRYCEWACPYGAVHFDEEAGTMSKCDFCRDLLDKGENPACVDACVMRALKFGDLEELRAEYGDIAEIAPLPSADLTNPSIVIKPHRDAQPSGEGRGKINQLPEEM